MSKYQQAKMSEEQHLKEMERLAIMEIKITELQLLMKTIKETATPSSHQDRYQKLDVQHVPSLMPLRKVPDWASLFTTNPPQPGSSKSRIVQPFWSHIIHQLPTDKVVLVDKHTTTSFGSRKPDIVGYLAGQPQSVAHIALIGQLKARRSGGKNDFDDEEKGHLESFLEELLINYQPWRSSMCGFLSDGVLIQFFELFVKPKTQLWEAKPMQLVNDGARGLAALLEGPGHNGLKLEFGGEEVVIKRFNDDRVAARFQEFTHLSAVATLGELVPRVLGVAGNALILQPLGDKLASSVDNWEHALANQDDFVQLINILEQVHKRCGLVHRDVRLNNFLRIKGTTQVFLNDWGSAAAADVLTDFDGALQHAPDEILESWQSGDQYRPAFSHDLEMVVRTVFHSTNMMTFREIQAEENVQKLRAFWAHHLEPAVWQRMLQAAQACHYEALKAIISELLPGQVQLPFA